MPRFLLALAAATVLSGLLPAAASASPQDDGTRGMSADDGGAQAEEAEARRRARERWEAMSSEERRRLIERYEQFRSLPPEKKDELRRRLEELGGPQGAALVREKLEEARERAPERIEQMRRHAAYLERFEESMLATVPEALRARYEALEPEAREGVRHRAFRALMAMGRRLFVEKYATAEEQARLEAAGRRERYRIMGGLYARARERVVAPEKERLDRLPAEERRVEEARLWERAYWSTMGRHAAEVTTAVVAALDAPAPPGHLDERFEETFGVRPGQIGVEEAPRALLWALHLVPSARRERFLSAAREGLKRVVALPEGERRTAFRELLSLLRREDPPEPPPPRER